MEDRDTLLCTQLSPNIVCCVMWLCSLAEVTLQPRWSRDMANELFPWPLSTSLRRRLCREG
eukprot:6155620-Alexandrium_andersonii.AAC.1